MIKNFSRLRSSFFVPKTSYFVSSVTDFPRFAPRRAIDISSGFGESFRFSDRICILCYVPHTIRRFSDE